MLHGCAQADLDWGNRQRENSVNAQPYRSLKKAANEHKRTNENYAAKRITRPWQWRKTTDRSSSQSTKRMRDEEN